MTYTSSFSKTVAPGVRVGYFVLPERLVAPFEHAAVQAVANNPHNHDTQSPPAIGSASVRRTARCTTIPTPAGTNSSCR